MGASDLVIGKAPVKLRAMAIARVDASVECVMRDLASSAGVERMH